MKGILERLDHARGSMFARQAIADQRTARGEVVHGAEIGSHMPQVKCKFGFCFARLCFAVRTLFSVIFEVGVLWNATWILGE